MNTDELAALLLIALATRSDLDPTALIPTAFNLADEFMEGCASQHNNED